METTCLISRRRITITQHFGREINRRFYSYQLYINHHGEKQWQLNFSFFTLTQVQAIQILMPIFEIVNNKCPMWSDWKEQIKHQPKVRHSLLWEYDLEGFDWLYMRALVVERVIERGWDEDYYALFALYGGNGGDKADYPG